MGVVDMLVAAIARLPLYMIYTSGWIARVLNTDG
jgi:hypothetical protein